MRNFLVIVCFVSLFSCGDSKITIDCKDVKGTITANGAELIIGNLKTGDGDFEQAILKYEDYELVISPTKNSFQEEVEREQLSDEAFGVVRSEEKTGNDYLFYKEDVEFAGEKSQGYRFFVFKKGKTGNFILKGKGKMFGSITSKENAEQAFEDAKTFVPSN